MSSQLSFSVSDSGFLQTEESPALPMPLGLTTTWVKGLTFHADGSVASGFYDADKTLNDDAYMCWAGASSNMIAWWQNYYGTTTYTNNNPPTDQDDILATFRRNWKDEGYSERAACTWWLTGDTDGSALYEGNGEDGGYYTNLYSEYNINTSTFYHSLNGVDAASTGDILSSIMEQGGIMSVSVSSYYGSVSDYGSETARHALTLWGITRDEQNGEITTLYVNDSNDGWDDLFAVDLVYDDINHCYQLRSDKFNHQYHLDGFTALSAFRKSDTTAPIRPEGLTVKLQGNQAQFSWLGAWDASEVYYEVTYQSDSNIEYLLTTDTNLTVQLTATGSYDWWVRARDAAGNISDWKYGGTFNATAAAPTVIFNERKHSHLANGKDRVTFTWSGDAGASYQLSLNREVIYSGKETSYTTTLSEGEYNYAITATNSMGYSFTYNGGRFFCDNTAPSAPSQLQARQVENDIVFNWQGVSDLSGVSYYLYYKRSNEREYTHIRSIVSDSYTLSLSNGGTYDWCMCAMDSNGNLSSWVYGPQFNYRETPLSFTLLDAGMTKASEGSTRVTLSWEGEAGLNYVVSVNNETVYSGSRTSISLLLPDGRYNYSITATDKDGRSSTRSASFSCDATAPNEPTNLRAELQGYRATFSWDHVQDSDSISYQLGYRTSPGEEIICSEWSTKNSFSLNLTKEATYLWYIRAADSSGNTSEWVAGTSFSYVPSKPVLTLNAPSIKKARAGESWVTFSWKCSENANCILTIDGKQVYSGSATSTKQRLRDGQHSYTLVATNDIGYSDTQTGTLFCDTVAPELSSISTFFSNKKDGSAKVYLWWSCSEAASYRVSLGSELIYSGTDTSCSFTCESGTYSYTITATDAAGLSSTVKKKFTLDVTPPVLTLVPCKLKANKKSGKTDVQLSWKSEKDCTYTVTINGKTHSSGKKTTYTHSLNATESFTYHITATDKAGNSTISEERTIRVDTTAPALSALSCNMQADAQGNISTTISWLCAEKDNGVDYSIKVDGKAVKDALITTLADGSLSYQHSTPLKAGRHRYEITATDWAGNVTILKGENFVTPALSLGKPKLCKAAEGQVNALLSWSVDANSSYSLWIDGEEITTGITSGTKAGRYSYEATLRDGEHSYRVLARNEAGYFTQTEGSFVFDATAPEADICTAESTRGTNGKVKATLEWTGEPGVKYTLRVDGKNKFSGKKTSCTLTLTEGEYACTLVATDKAGNSTTLDTLLTVDARGDVIWSKMPSLTDHELALSAGCLPLPPSAPGASLAAISLEQQALEFGSAPRHAGMLAGLA